MPKSDRLRFKDLRAAYRLTGECRELGRDPHGWRMHMLESLRALTGARVAMYLQIRSLGTPAERIEQPLACGLIDAEQRGLWLRYRAERAQLDDAFHLGYYRNFDGVLRTRDLEAVVELPPWRRSRHYNEYLRPCGLDDRITSSAGLGSAASSPIQVLVLHRAAVDGSFGRRAVRLVHLFHHELLTLVGDRLAMPTTQASAQGPRPASEPPDRGSSGIEVPGAEPVVLSPQLRQVLACAMQGDSEKRIANRLGISRHTVNRHMQRLYRRFGVHSRAELMYRCQEMLPR